jgi:hypothetical protein
MTFMRAGAGVLLSILFSYVYQTAYKKVVRLMIVPPRGLLEKPHVIE